MKWLASHQDHDSVSCQRSMYFQGYSMTSLAIGDSQDFSADSVVTFDITGTPGELIQVSLAGLVPAASTDPDVITQSGCDISI